MATFTVAKLIQLAMSKCSLTRPNTGELPTTNEIMLGIDVANLMIDEWAAEPDMLQSSDIDSKVLTAGTGTYTIGSGGDINTTKPISPILSAYVRDSSGLDTPLAIVTSDIYDGYEDKGLTQARPIALYYDPGVAQQASPLGTIYLYYIPDSSNTYTLYINSRKVLTNWDYDDPNADVTFDPAYGSCIVENLAVNLFRHYHSPKVPIPADMVARAANTKERIQRRNSTIPRADMDLPGTRRSTYNIYTGDNLL